MLLQELGHLCGPVEAFHVPDVDSHLSLGSLARSDSRLVGRGCISYEIRKLAWPLPLPLSLGDRV